MSSPPATRILILGGGFGGVTTAKALGKRYKRDRSVEVTLVNRDNYFVFVPMLASAAAGSIEALHVVAPIRRLLGPGVRFRAEEVVGIDLERRTVTTVSPTTGRERALPYDQLVLALGNVVNVSPFPGLAQHAMTIKTLGDALAIRNHVLQMLEAADIEPDPVTRREMLTFVVAGGGFSGVEMVGELNDMVREVIAHYPSIGRDQARVILLHGNDRILPELSAGVAEHALKALRRRGVDVRLNTRLAGATPHEAVLQGGEKIPTRTLIAAVGNAPPPVLDDLPVQKERGRLVVNECLRLPEYPNVWALGDNAVVPNAAWRDGRPSPPTAQFALRQGKTLAHNIDATLRGRRPRPFAYGGLGQLCLVGHGAGVGEIKFGIKLKGWLGWFAWRSVYWSKLPSLGRRLQVGADWAFDLVLPRELAQINLARTQAVGRAHYEPGEVIFRQGDPGDLFYLITAGEVEVVHERPTGEALVVARLGRGDHFGETALLTGRPRNATIRCLTPVDVLTVCRDDFTTLAGTWLQLAENLRRVSDEREARLPVSRFVSGAVVRSVLEGAGGELAPGGGPPAMIKAILTRSDSGGEIPLEQDLISLGRSPENNVVVPDPAASRRHALIQREGDRYVIDDLGGRNGTWVNGRRVNERAPLQNGDVIRIGRTQFTFRIEAVAPPRAPAGLPAGGAGFPPQGGGPPPWAGDRAPAGAYGPAQGPGPGGGFPPAGAPFPQQGPGAGAPPGAPFPGQGQGGGVPPGGPFPQGGGGRQGSPFVPQHPGGQGGPAGAPFPRQNQGAGGAPPPGTPFPQAGQASGQGGYPQQPPAGPPGAYPNQAGGGPAGGGPYQGGGGAGGFPPGGGHPGAYSPDRGGPQGGGVPPGTPFPRAGQGPAVPPGTPFPRQGARGGPGDGAAGRPGGPFGAGQPFGPGGAPPSGSPFPPQRPADGGQGPPPGAPFPSARLGQFPPGGPGEPPGGGSGPPGAGGQPGPLTRLIQSLDEPPRSAEGPPAAAPQPAAGEGGGGLALPSVTSLIRGLDAGEPDLLPPSVPPDGDPFHGPAPAPEPHQGGALPRAPFGGAAGEGSFRGPPFAQEAFRAPPAPVQDAAGGRPGPAPPEGAGSITGLLRELDAAGADAGPDQLDTTLPFGPGRPPPGARRAPPRLLLRGEGGAAAGLTFTVDARGAMLGRAADNAVRLADGGLSRRHAKIEFRDGAYWLVDQGSTNGTRLNGVRLTAPQQLRTGDVIELGSSRLTVTVE
jgi:NADH dehydrogenase